jgi:hypothetical protein
VEESKVELEEEAVAVLLIVKIEEAEDEMLSLVPLAAAEEEVWGLRPVQVVALEEELLVQGQV